MIIGIVLARVPGYSETFLWTLIRSIGQNHDKVVLFVDKGSDQKIPPGVPVYACFESVFGIQCLGWLVVIFRFISSFKMSTKYITRNITKGNMTLRKSLKSYFISNHILGRQIDCLHFGFATLAVGREDLGIVMGVKTIVSLRGYDVDRYPLTKKIYPYTRLWSTVNRVHAVSQYLLKKAESTGLNAASKGTVIYPAVEIEPLKHRTPSAYLVEDCDRLEILTVGRLHWVKGGLDLIKALSIFKRGHPNFLLHWIGEGDAREELSSYILFYGLKDNVILHGRLSHSETLLMMRRSHIYIQYSIFEGFCNAVLEAQGAGLLCIVSDAGGLPENIIDNITGFIVPALRPDLLASKILYVLGLSRRQLDQIIFFAHKRVKENFNQKDYPSKIYTLYK
ncbi:glycosyltransferase family 4 protein [Schleiferiaceae bacterium]|nr:glycosyltransferase family 4 protein [Schleiferiaceae bacterium]